MKKLNLQKREKARSPFYIPIFFIVVIFMLIGGQINLIYFVLIFILIYCVNWIDIKKSD